ncbi:MAG: T9SS type A sorting domain-containing protein [Ignavibacteria bacterium]|nr:T9SS type A sorting domain-containing protein [Ignavibacteria bacterium]
MRRLYLTLLFSIIASITYSQAVISVTPDKYSPLLDTGIVKSIIPDTGSQGAAFPIVVHGTLTEWTLAPYYVVNFSCCGVGSFNVVIVNDSTLNAVVFADGKASLGWHKCMVADEYHNLYIKDSAFFIFLNAPVAPTPLLPFNNSSNIAPNPYFLWDSNVYVSTFRFQIASDSTFEPGVIVFDTVLANTPYTLRLGVLASDTRYYWRVNATNTLGTSEWSTIFKFRVKSVGISNISTEIPANYSLLQNYPNPFNPSTKIRFQIPKNGLVKLKVYDVSGKEISGILSEHLSAGTYEFTWNASSLPSGVYFYLMESGDFREVKKAVLLK